MIKESLYSTIRSFFLKRQEQWEKVCLKCGICCYEKENQRCRVIIDLSKPCEYLNEETKRCTIYKKRFQICKNCEKVTLFHALFSRYLPSTCGYVKKYRKWKFISPPTLK
jgi:uncharacterized cysteine cluster protein YcgN (CxxCxxCC family)